MANYSIRLIISMYTYHFHPTLLLRTPIYNFQYYSDSNLAEVLNSPIFRNAIYFSSEAFYNELKKVNFELAKLDKKALDTLKKYFNRMCFRPTPFGICSTFGVLNWGNGVTDIKISDNNFKPNIQFSYAKSIEYAQLVLADTPKPLTYQLTHAIYKTGNEYRFIKANHDNAQFEFVIDSLKADAFFTKMLRYLRSPHTITEILFCVCEEARCEPAEANNYIQWLIDCQIITHLSEPNITGVDYLERLLRDETDNLVKTAFDLTKQISTTADINKLTATESDLRSNNFYVNLEVKLPDAQMAMNYQGDIIDALTCLNRITTQQETTGLAEFKRNFIRKFDGQAIPLLMAIDPEVGVGYGNLAVEEDNVNIAKNILGNPQKDSHSMIWSDVHALFFNKCRTSAHSGNVITITDDDLSRLEYSTSQGPNSFSVMFRLVNNKVFVESAGGISATSLIGRFTPFDDKIKQLALNMAENESRSNPEIVFAEIAHICHDKTANIDRREHIYDYEIPVLTQSIMPTDRQILLSDLWISVIGGSIVIQSKRLGKRVIPRLSSAFNYTRNDLAIFRFLCDLQSAEIKTSLGFNLSHYFPGLEHYPRVEYKNTILQLAYWHLKKDTFDKVFNADTNNKINVFKTLRNSLQLPQLIALTQADHQLVFDLDNKDDVLFFLDTIKGLKQLTLKEYLLPATDTTIVRNEKGKAHINQFVASVYHRQQIYKPVVAPIIENIKTLRKYIPGSEWMYMKLYCHSIRANELFVEVIGAILKKLQKSGLVHQWFFIRYNDPAYHIRLRLKIDPLKQQTVFEILHKSLNIYIKNGLISNYNIDTYERELERYSHLFMPEFEHTFYTSSNLILEFLKRHSGLVSTHEILEFAIVSVTDMLYSLGFEGNNLTAFLDNVTNSFLKEFGSIDNLKYQLDTEFRKQKGVIETVSKNINTYHNLLQLNEARQLFTNSLKQLKQVTSSKKLWQNKWAADLIHMHLNRLFVNESRKQEMMIYYMLSKHVRSAQARLKAQVINTN